MEELKKQQPYNEELDFSRDSRIRESLLNDIRDGYFRVLEDDELDMLNAAGTPGEAIPRKLQREQAQGAEK